MWIVWIAAGILVVLVVYLLNWATSDGLDNLDDAEKVAVQFWTVELFHYDKQKMEQLIVPNTEINTDAKPLYPPKPGKVFVTSFPKRIDKREVYMYISPELDKVNGLLQQLTLVLENGEWKVLDEKGYETRRIPFEDFQQTPEYKMMFGNAEWKEVTIH
jgi:hypothetical protein